MIIIDEKTHERLIQALRALPDLANRQCIHFKLTGHASREKIRQQLIASVQKHLPPQQVQLYFCDDVEMFLIATAIPPREGRKIIFEVASAFDIQPADQAADVYDLDLHHGRLLMLLEKKIESRRKAQEAVQKQQVQTEAGFKRQEILNVKLSDTAQEVSTRRSKHSLPEIMIIENDVAARRLVENLLQKKYKLTMLDRADGALSAYANLAPDILFLDIELPDVTGHELLRRIMALDPEAYVVMLSGSSGKENIIQAINCGAKGFVTKPLSRDRLLHYIEHCPSIREHV